MDEISSKHVKTLYKNLREIRETGKFFDFIICIDNKQEYPVHRVILAANSDYFRAMLSHDSTELKTNWVNLEDISIVAMEAILDFFYTCEINLTVDNVQEILIASSILQISAIQALSINYIKDRIDTTNCLGVATISERFNLTELFDLAVGHCINSFQTVMMDEELLQLDENTLSKILSSDYLNICDEEKVLEAIFRWIQADEVARKPKLDTLVEHVRFASLEPIRLVKLSSEECIKNSQKCRDLIENAKNYLLVPSLYDPSTCPNIKPRYSKQQRLFAVGGWTDEFKSIASAEMYDPNTDNWIELEPMAERRCGVGLTTLGDSIYAVGGHDGRDYLGSIERYDVNSRRWFKDVSSMNHVRTSVGVVALAGQVYAIGGQISAGATDRVERYDPKTNTWTECAPLNKPRLGSGIAVLHNYIYVIGGSESNSIYETVERYNPTNDEWTYVTPMTTARKHLGCTTCRGKIFAVGGRNKYGELDSAECYDPSDETWTTIAPMHMKRCGIGVVELGGLVYVVGGQNEDARLNVVEAYDPVIDRWVWKKSMNHGRLGGGMTVYPMKMH